MLLLNFAMLAAEFCESYYIKHWEYYNNWEFKISQVRNSIVCKCRAAGKMSVIYSFPVSGCMFLLSALHSLQVFLNITTKQTQQYVCQI